MNFGLKNRLSKLLFAQDCRDFLSDMVEEFRMNNKPVDYIQSMAASLGSIQADVYRDMLEKLHSGASLSQAMAGYFDDATRLLIQVGEESNREIESMETAIRIFDAQSQVVRIVFGKLFFPFYLTMLALCFSGIIAFVLVPNFLQSGLQLSDFGPMMRSAYVSMHFLEKYWIFSISGIALVCYGIYWTFPNWSGKARGILDRYFPLYTVYSVYQGVYILLVLSGMMRNNVTPREAVSRMLGSANPYLLSHLEQIQEWFEEGESIADSIDTGLFNKKVIARIRRYEQNGQAETLFIRLGSEGLPRMLAYIQATMTPTTYVLNFIITCLIATMAYEYAQMAGLISKLIGYS